MGSQFETEVARLMMQFNTPGVAVELLSQGKRHGAHLGRLSADGSLPMTKKARFATVCHIKTLIAIEILMLAEKGEINLDAGVAEYLPELGKGPKAKGHFLKIRHLLSHTGGFRSFPVQHLMPLAHESWQNCVDLLHDTDQLFEPGTVFDDEHLGHIILGQLLTRLKGKPFLDLICEDILSPLGIKPSNRTKDAEQPEIYAARHLWNVPEKKWEVEPDVYSEPDAAFGSISYLSLTCGDLLRLGEALLADSSESGKSFLSLAVKKQLFSQVIRVPAEVSPMRFTRWHVSGFGLGMATFRGGHRGFMTTGRGQNSCVIFDKEGRSVLALAMNTTNVLEREALLNTLLAKFAGDTSIVPEPKTLDMDFDDFIKPFTTRDIGGVYVGFAPEPIEIFAGPRSFVVRINKEDRYQFEASPENRLVMRAKIPVSVGLFQDPVSLKPCLMMGMHSFKKVA